MDPAESFNRPRKIDPPPSPVKKRGSTVLQLTMYCIHFNLECDTSYTSICPPTENMTFKYFDFSDGAFWSSVINSPFFLSCPWLSQQFEHIVYSQDNISPAIWRYRNMFHTPHRIQFSLEYVKYTNEVSLWLLPYIFLFFLPNIEQPSSSSLGMQVNLKNIC